MLSVLVEEAGICSVSPEKNLLATVRLLCYFPQGAANPAEGLSCQNPWIWHKIPSSHCYTPPSQRDTAKLVVEQRHNLNHFICGHRQEKGNLGKRREGGYCLLEMFVKGIFWFKLRYTHLIGNSASWKNFIPNQEKMSWEISKFPVKQVFQMLIVLEIFGPCFIKEMEMSSS